MPESKRKGKFGIAAKVILINAFCISVCLIIVAFIVISLERKLASEMLQDQVE